VDRSPVTIRLNLSRALAALGTGPRAAVTPGETTYQVVEGTTVEELVRALNPAWDRAVMVVVNGTMAPWERRLAAGDQVNIHPLVSGGSASAASPRTDIVVNS